MRTQSLSKGTQRKNQKMIIIGNKNETHKE